jgi:outer membrane lipopolysaccharide assembly protein LptE/RlpB
MRSDPFVIPYSLFPIARRCDGGRFSTLGAAMRPIVFSSTVLSASLVLLSLALPSLSGCGYHTLGAATHLPPDVKTLAVPVFATQTDTNGAETAITEAVVREFATRTRFRVTTNSGADADAVLHGIILKQTTTPLTYNAATQQSSSFIITIVASVTLTARDGKILYQNKNYIFRQQYQSTTNLPTFLQEDPAAVQRLSREFARQLVADVIEGF